MIQHSNAVGNVPFNGGRWWLTVKESTMQHNHNSEVITAGANGLFLEQYNPP
jgi:hypothetical protein